MYIRIIIIFFIGPFSSIKEAAHRENPGIPMALSALSVNEDLNCFGNSKEN